MIAQPKFPYGAPMLKFDQFKRPTPKRGPIKKIFGGHPFDIEKNKPIKHARYDFESLDFGPP